MYAEHPPSAALRPFVECYWTLRASSDPAAAPIRVLPDGCMDIIFDLGAAEGSVVGTMTRSLLAETLPAVDLLGVRFRPGAAPALLGAPAREATDERIGLDGLWGRSASELAERLAAARSTPLRLALLERELLLRLADLERLDAMSRHAVALVVASRGAIRIDDLAARIGLGSRQLERVFHEVVGVSPKLFARIARFRALTDALRAEAAPRWASLAADLGFYDQAHLVREVRAFAGLTPTELGRTMSDSSKTPPAAPRIVRLGKRGGDRDPLVERLEGDSDPDRGGD